MVSRAAALSGRASKMVVASKHFVLKNQMEGPYPDNTKKILFANGCFWGSEKGAWRLPGKGYRGVYPLVSFLLCWLRLYHRLLVKAALGLY